MQKFVLTAILTVLAMALALPDAEARRLGGARSMGTQRSITPPPPAATPARPGQQAQPAAQPGAAPAAGAQPASGLSRWAPLLGGLAIGGLLGALMGSSGLGSMLLSWLLIAAAVFACVALFRMLAQRRQTAQPLHYASAGPSASGQYAPLGQETVAAPPPSQASGFDAQMVPAAAPAVPAGFDVAGFLRAAKLNFMKLQAANDAGDRESLREFCSAELFAELQRDLEGRHGTQQTDVVSLNADLLEVTTEGERHWASVRFSGQIRETPGSTPEGFEEVWNLCKPVDGSSGWLLAGIQQMH